MSGGPYAVGTTVRLEGSFADQTTGDAADPDTVTLIVRAPDGTRSEYPSPIRDDAGEYHLDINFDAVGIWYYRWETATGTDEFATLDQRLEITSTATAE